MIKKSHSFLILSILMLGPAHDVLGQAGWRQSLPALEESDIEQIKQVARQEMTSKPVGTVLEWSNDKTGNQGTVHLVDLFDRDERQCRTLAHVIDIRTQGRWRNTVTICQTQNGTDWAFAHPRSQ